MGTVGHSKVCKHGCSRRRWVSGRWRDADSDMGGSWRDSALARVKTKQIGGHQTAKMKNQRRQIGEERKRGGQGGEGAKGWRRMCGRGRWGGGSQTAEARSHTHAGRKTHTHARTNKHTKLIKEGVQGLAQGARGAGIH